MSQQEPGYFVVDLRNDSTGMALTVRHVAAASEAKAVACALAWVVSPGDWRCIGTDRDRAPDGYPAVEAEDQRL